MGEKLKVINKLELEKVFLKKNFQGEITVLSAWFHYGKKKKIKKGTGCVRKTSLTT